MRSVLKDKRVLITGSSRGIGRALAVVLLLGAAVSGYSVGAAAADHSADIRATHLTQPVNPNASQESINLLAYLYSLSDSRQMVIG